MEGIVKTAEAPVAQPTLTPASSVNQETVGSEMNWQGIPINVFNYFGMNIQGADNRMMNQLKTVFNHALAESRDKTLGEVMLNISALDRRLGTPKIGETRIGKMFNWVALNNQIKDMEKQREAFVTK